jgi:uncharacterized membrane protein YfcA
VFLAAIFVVAVLGGATAAVSGFGIGSLLTPLLALQMPMPAAVAAVALPHAVATTLRCWRLRRAIDWTVLRSFGVVSAAAGLTGAFWYARLESGTLTVVLGALLVLTAFAGLTGWTSRVRLRGPVPWALGLLSGLFGGMAGNQGGLRSAALLAFGLGPLPFVATATATGVLVDAARTPIYLWREGSGLTLVAGEIAAATCGVVLGTLLGERILVGLTPERFRQIVSAIVGAIGVWLIAAQVW